MGGLAASTRRLWIVVHTARKAGVTMVTTYVGRINRWDVWRSDNNGRLTFRAVDDINEFVADNMHTIRKFCAVNRARRFTGGCYEHEDKLSAMGFDT